MRAAIAMHGHSAMHSACYVKGPEMPDSHAARHSGRAISDRELRAMAYAIADRIETRALALRRANPAMTHKAAIHAALAAMARD